MTKERLETFGISGDSKDAGFSLIEVLITLFILSFGMLGLAAIQLQTLQARWQAEAEAQAVQRTSAMLERIRIDREAALSGAYNQSCSDDPAGASSAVRDWLAGVVQALPEGQGCIRVTGDDVLATAVVQVKWHERGGGGDAQDGERHYRLQTQF